jgi:hypothetical protein
MLEINLEDADPAWRTAPELARPGDPGVTA